MDFSTRTGFLQCHHGFSLSRHTNEQIYVWGQMLYFRFGYPLSEVRPAARLFVEAPPTPATLSNATTWTILTTKSNVASTLFPYCTFPYGSNVRRNFVLLTICLDFVERTKFYNKLVWHCCHFWQQSRMLLQKSRTLLRHCCWCGWGFSGLSIYRLKASV